MAPARKLVSRRRVLQSLAAGGTLAFCSFPAPAIAQSLRKLLFMMPVDFIIEFVPEFNAVVGGHFKAQGLDVEIGNTRGTSVAIQQVIAGRAQFATVGPLDIMKAYAKQQSPVVSVATITQGSLFSIVSLKSAPLLTPADMRGKTIGVVSLGGGSENILDLTLASAGMTPKDVPRQPVGTQTPATVELLKQGRLQGFISIPETNVGMLRAKEAVEIVNTAKFAPMPGQCWMTTQDFIKSEPETVGKFIRALRASVEEILTADTNMILDRVEKVYDIGGNKDRGYRLDAMKAYVELMLTEGRANLMRNVPERWHTGAELTTKANIADVLDKIDQLYTNRFVDAAFH